MFEKMKHTKSVMYIFTLILVLLLSNLYMAKGIKKSIRETKKIRCFLGGG